MMQVYHGSEPKKTQYEHNPAGLYTEAWFVHICVATQTNITLACQTQGSQPLYKSAQSTISSESFDL